MTKPIYMDHAAATPMDPQVLAAMQPYFAERFYNPSALYLAAKEVAQNVAAARAQIAETLGARHGEIIFTAGGTEANNLAIHGVMQQFKDGNVVVSSIEHDSVRHVAAVYESREAPVLADGRVDLAQLEKLIDDKTVLVSIMYANNEIGTILPIKQVATLMQTIHQKRKQQGNNRPLYLHTDACQAANYLDLHVSRLGADLMTINGGKIYGPKQSGLLYVRAGVQLTAQVLGGGQERAYRSGTENVPGIIGLAKALELVQAKRHNETARLQTLQQDFIKQLSQTLPQTMINGSLKHRLPNNVHVTIPGQDNERLIMALDQAGIQAAAGSACSASSEEPSHVLCAIGLNDVQAQASLRFTMGQATTPEHVTQTVDTLVKLIA